MFTNLTGEPLIFYLGIDQHAKQLTINPRDRQGNAIVKRQVSSVLRKSSSSSSKQLTAARCTKADCGFWAIVEACGFNEA